MGIKMSRLQLRMPDDLDKLVIKYAQENGYSKNTVVNMALREFFKTNQMEIFEAKPEGVA